MLYHLLISFYPQVPIFNVARYITFRTAAASMTALVVSLVLGPWLIRRLRDFQVGQVIRQEGPESHRTKAGTHGGRPGRSARHHHRGEGLPVISGIGGHDQHHAVGMGGSGAQRPIEDS